MGIYIKGLEMPKSCIACHLNFGEKRPEYGLTIYCPYSGGVISWRDKAFDNGQLASCGIVFVPPHGDLIDKDATMNAILEERGEDTACWFAGIVNDMPAIVPSDKVEEDTGIQKEFMQNWHEEDADERSGWK